MVERGADIKDLTRSGDQKTFTFEHKEKQWEVHYRDVPWDVRFNAIERAWKPTLEGDTEFDVSQYYTDMLKAALVDINGQPVAPSTLRMFDHDVISRLVTLVPSPLLTTAVADLKKDS
jgi:hypothetical protein